MPDPANLLPETLEGCTTIADTASLLVADGVDIKQIPIEAAGTVFGYIIVEDLGAA
jgi:hypothetical protein